MRERIELVHLHKTNRYSVAELAEAFGVSRKTAYKWLARHASGGAQALRERSRAPRRHPNATAPAVVDAVLRAKERRPRWGPAKLLPGPEEPLEIRTAWPAVSTRGAILDRRGLVAKRRPRRRTPPWTRPFHACQGPNDVWCADFQGLVSDQGRGAV